jgi:hypothetical protein
MHPASPVSKVSVPHFAYQRMMQCSTKNISYDFYIAPFLSGYIAHTALPLIPELAHKLDRTDLKRKFGK